MGGDLHSNHRAMRVILAEKPGGGWWITGLSLGALAVDGAISRRCCRKAAGFWMGTLVVRTGISAVSTAHSSLRCSRHCVVLLRPSGGWD